MDAATPTPMPGAPKPAAPASWWRDYDRRWWPKDFWAGLTLAAYAIPVSLAYATLAGMPPYAGIYCFLVGGLGYALFGTSRQLAIGPTAAISLMFGVTLANLVASTHGSILPLAAITTLLVAALYFLVWLFRLSVIINFISDSILVGFKAGAALLIASTVLPSLLGVPKPRGNFCAFLWRLLQELGATNPLVLAIGVVALALLIWGEKLLPRRPIALMVVVLALIVAPLVHFASRGVYVVGWIKPGLPGLALSQIKLLGYDAQVWQCLVGLAFACFLLSCVESISASRAMALGQGNEIDLRREFLGLGVANLLAALFQGYPVAGGLSQTAVNAKAGARSQLSLVFASLALAIVLLCLTPVFKELPQAVLGAVVLVSVSRLVDVAAFRQLWSVNKLDFAAAAVAFVGVLVLGILNGVLFAVVASLLMVLWRSSTPHVAFLGRIPRTDRFSDLERHPDNECLPGLIAFRVEAPLFYFNVESVRERVWRRIDGTPHVSMVVCDLSTSPYVDTAGARMLVHLYEQLTARGIVFKVAEAHSEVRDILRAVGLEEKIGHISRKRSLAEIIEKAERKQGVKLPPDQL